MAAPVYVSSVKGHLVPRFGGLLLPGPVVYIGARHTPDGLVWDETAIVAIPQEEFNRYRREYTRQISVGALHVRTAEEFAACIVPVNPAAPATDSEPAEKAPVRTRRRRKKTQTGDKPTGEEA